MADRDNNYKEVISSLLGGMENIVSSKTVVGTPTTVGDTTIIPDVKLPATEEVQEQTNDNNKTKKLQQPRSKSALNSLGYANVVLMSIIVIIIVAIICVFIFM